MDYYSLGVLIVFVGAVIPCGVLGFLIAFLGKRSLIAGWDETKVRNPKAYGSVIGWSLLGLSLFLGIVVYAWSAGLASEALLVGLVLLGSLIQILGLLYANKKSGSVIH